ncbi:MAG: hypothetical protein ACM3ZE_29935, partial [Myxococcales bacterium]
MMNSKQWQRASGVVASALLLLGLSAFVGCGGKMPGGKGVPGMDALPGGSGAACSADITNADAIMAANFGFQGELEGKVKAALSAGANFQALAADVETEVAVACGNLAKDLGATDIEPKDKGPGKRAEAACNAAVKAIGEMKAKVKGSLKVEVVPPKCSASMDAMMDCAAKCDVNVKPGSVEAKCEGGEISGSCEGECKGTCSVEAGGKCEGTCSGSCNGKCEGKINGKCDGKCDGKSDSKDSKNTPCAGTCDGKCDGNANASCNGTCKGTCSASCKVEAKGKCNGTCSGGCSVKMKEPKCSGEVQPPEMSGECKANCDAKVSAKLECVPASVTVKIEGAADAQAATKLKGALEKNLPALLKVTMGMKGKLEKVSGNVKTSLEGVKAA